MKDITAGVIKAAVQTLYPKAEPARGNRQVITPAQAVINHSAELGHCTPIRVKRFKVAKTIRRAVDRDYIDRFIAEVSADLGAMMLFMNQSGCRIGPATALTWGDVDLARRTVTLPKDKNGHSHVFRSQPGGHADARPAAEGPPQGLRLRVKGTPSTMAPRGRAPVPASTISAPARQEIWHGPRHACRISCRAPSLVSRPLKKDFWHLPSQY